MLLPDIQCAGPRGSLGPSLPAQLSPPFIAFPKAWSTHPTLKPDPPPAAQLPDVFCHLGKSLSQGDGPYAVVMVPCQADLKPGLFCDKAPSPAALTERNLAVLGP